MRVLTAVFYVAAVFALIATLAAVAFRTRRVVLLVVAAVAYAVAGVLAAASIGLLLVLVSAVCVTLAIKTASERSGTSV